MFVERSGPGQALPAALPYTGVCVVSFVGVGGLLLLRTKPWNTAKHGTNVGSRVPALGKAFGLDVEPAGMQLAGVFIE